MHARVVEDSKLQQAVSDKNHPAGTGLPDDYTEGCSSQPFLNPVNRMLFLKKSEASYLRRSSDLPRIFESESGIESHDQAAVGSFDWLPTQTRSQVANVFARLPNGTACSHTLAVELT